MVFVFNYSLSPEYLTLPIPKKRSCPHDTKNGNNLRINYIYGITIFSQVVAANEPTKFPDGRKRSTVSLLETTLYVVGNE